MAETLLVYPSVLRSSKGDDLEARACGRERDDATWEAWFEFEPRRGGATIRTRSETTQPDRAQLLAWARGISRVYLEGALARAVPGGATFTPAATPDRRASAPEPEGVLDPFAIHAHGQSLLRRHLEGLSAALLCHIARAHDMLGALDESAVDRLTKEELVDMIVVQTQRRAQEERVRRDEGPSPK